MNHILVRSPWFRRALVLGLLAAAGSDAHAQTTPSLILNFDNQNSQAFDSGNVFFMFAQGNSNFTATYFNGTTDANISLTQSGGSYFSPSFSLADLNGQGFNITEANSTVLYVSYGSALNVTQGTPNPTGTNDPNIGTRWQPIEFTFAPATVNGTQTGFGAGGGDLTSINVFSIPMQATAVEQGKTVGFTNGTTTQSVLSQLTSTLGASAPLAIMHSNITDNSGNFVRAIAPNSFGQGTTPFYNLGPGVYTPSPQGGYGIGQYHSWSTAVGQLKTNMGNGQVVSLTGNTAYSDNITNVFYAYNFTPAITPTGDGNYSITFTGNINYSGYLISNNSIAAPSGTYSNLSFTMAPDRVTTSGNNDMELSAAINQQVFTNASTIANIVVANGTVFSAGWADVGNQSTTKQAQIEQAMQQRVWGDFSEEMLLGFFFNPNTANITSSTLFPANPDDPSTYNQYAYLGNLTVDQYNTFGNIIWQDSNGTIYANPYDDRFGNNLLGTGTNVTTAHWDITLMPDAAVPEPAETAVVLALGSLTMASLRRRRRNRAFSIYIDA